MQIKAVLDRVHKIKGFVYQGVRFVDGGIEVEVRSRHVSRPYCSGCGRRGPTYDHLPARWFCFLPLCAISVYLVYAMRRVDCPRCGVTFEVVPWAEGKRHLTHAHVVFLARRARRLSWREVALIFKTGWSTSWRGTASRSHARRCATGPLSAPPSCNLSTGGWSMTCFAPGSSTPTTRRSMCWIAVSIERARGGSGSTWAAGVIPIPCSPTPRAEPAMAPQQFLGGWSG